VDIAIIAEFVPILVLNVCVMILFTIGPLICVLTITVAIQILKVISFAPPTSPTKIAITWGGVMRMDKPVCVLIQLTESLQTVVCIGTLHFKKTE
jgi:hypothetical protein